MHSSSAPDPAGVAARLQWNATPCGWGPHLRAHEHGSRAFFAEVQRRRYEVTDPWILERIPFASTNGERVLEIGFGMGTDLATFAHHGAEAFGIDLSEEHHRLTRQNMSHRGLSAKLTQADAAYLPLRSDTFDIVYSNGVFHHTRDAARCVSEAYRVLRPGGRLIMTVYHKYSAFHIGSVLAYRGIVLGNLKRLGYAGLLATIEYGADGVRIKPWVRTYSKAEVGLMLRQFSSAEVSAAHFRREHLPLGCLLPAFIEPLLESHIGWYVIAFAIK